MPLKPMSVCHLNAFLLVNIALVSNELLLLESYKMISDIYHVSAL